MKKHYELLGIEENANTSKVKEAFREKLKDFESEILSAEQIKIVEAYVVLSDDTKRKKYDAVSDVEYSSQLRMKWEGDFEELCDNLRYHIRHYGYAIEKQKSDGLFELGMGVLLFIIGLGITIASYSGAKSGGSYVILYGLIFSGAWKAIKGFGELKFAMECLAEHSKNPGKMWETFLLV